jgi:hypothetical protein
VATAVIVAGLLDPAWLVEIEAEAILPTRNARTRTPLARGAETR